MEDDGLSTRARAQPWPEIPEAVTVVLLLAAAVAGVAHLSLAPRHMSPACSRKEY